MGTKCLFGTPRAALRRRNPWVPVETTARIIPTIVTESAGMQRSDSVRNNRRRHRNRRPCRVLQSTIQALSGPNSMQPATREPIYLDHSATTPVWPEVVDAMQEFFADSYGNPSSIHAAGRSAYAGLQNARSSIAAHIGAEPSEIIFTGCGTEGNNAALRGISLARRAATGANRIVSTAIEHHAVLETLEDLAELHGFEPVLLPVDCQGRIDPSELKEALQEPTALVSCMYANNEVGTVQPLAEVGEICEAANVPLHTDAVQALTRVPVSVDALKVAALSISAHKFHGPKGVGFLYLRRNTPFRPYMTGGGHEGGRRAGTENVPLIVGMAKALDLCMANAADEATRLQKLRDELITNLLKDIEGVHLTGSRQDRLSHHASFVFDGLEAESILIGLDMAGIMASSGSACTSGAHQPSHVLSAMGIDPPASYGAIRFSLGRDTSRADVEYVVGQMQRITEQLHAAQAFAV